MEVRHKHLPNGDPAGIEKPSSAKLAARRHCSLGKFGLDRTLYERIDGEYRPWPDQEEEGEAREKEAAA
ncbi:hypothetical protein PUN28_009766 [Cardiocondyla obscurior]|uniref:Uncharacterized protein n=1 Tax=Cardiocondyla obscurior TaxID=286306 RepID=A0AAW2FLT6_9HYME